MSATDPSGPRSTPSYSLLGDLIVRLAVKRRRRLACCCRVLVVNGAGGFSWRSFCSILRDDVRLPCRGRRRSASICVLARGVELLAVPFGQLGLERILRERRLLPASASPPSPASTSSSSVFTFGLGFRRLLRLGLGEGDRGFAPTPSGRSERPAIVQYSSGMNASISRSRSTMSRTATDCTRPALRCWASLLAEQRAELVADDAVEKAARFLGGDAVHVDGAGAARTPS